MRGVMCGPSMRRMSLLLVASLVLAGCLGSDEPEPEPEPEPSPTPTPTPTPAPSPPIDPVRPGFRFLAIGDQGTGEETQFRVAETMAAVCEERGCDFVVALGDNIYEAGAADENDEQFLTKFEVPYEAFEIPFYMALGNHDNNRDPLLHTLPSNPLSDEIIALGLGYWYETGDAEVAYAARTDRVSDRWVMPDRYYDFHGENASFYVIDSNTLMFYGQAVPPVDVTYQQQEAWIDPAIASSDAPWKFLLAHHPYVSNGNHGNAGRYEENNPSLPAQWEDILVTDIPYPFSGHYVKEFYENHVCGKVDLVLTGHDHNLQWLAATESCGHTEFVVSGAAAKTHGVPSPERNEVHFQQGETLGFWWFEVVGGTLRGVAIDVDGAVLFERTLTK